jgi:hypothetical protein
MLTAVQLFSNTKAMAAVPKKGKCPPVLPSKTAARSHSTKILQQQNALVMFHLNL